MSETRIDFLPGFGPEVMLRSTHLPTMEHSHPAANDVTGRTVLRSPACNSNPDPKNIESTGKLLGLFGIYHRVGLCPPSRTKLSSYCTKTTVIVVQSDMTQP